MASAYNMGLLGKQHIRILRFFDFLIHIFLIINTDYRWRVGTYISEILMVKASYVTEYQNNTE